MTVFLRKIVPIIDFHKDFNDYVNEMHTICKTIDTLKLLVTQINYDV